APQAAAGPGPARPAPGPRAAGGRRARRCARLHTDVPRRRARAGPRAGGASLPVRVPTPLWRAECWVVDRARGVVARWQDVPRPSPEQPGPMLLAGATFPLDV